MKRVAVALALVVTVAACSSSSTPRQTTNATCEHFYNKVDPLIVKGDLDGAYIAIINQGSVSPDITAAQGQANFALINAAASKDANALIIAASDMGHACPP